MSEELIDILINEPENDEKKLAMIAQLEELEKDPNPTTRMFIRMTKSAAQFMLFKSKYEEITTKGVRLIAEKSFSQAISTYIEGFVLYKEDFDNYLADDQSLLKTVNDSLASIRYAVDDYNNMQTVLNEAVRIFVSYVNELNYTMANKQFTVVEQAFHDLALARNAAANAGWLFKSIFTVLQEKDADLTDASFLPFAYRFTLGSGSAEFSGILGAMDAHWNDMQLTMKNCTYEAIQKQWTAGMNMLSSSSNTSAYTDAQNAFRFSLLYADLGIKINALNSYAYASSNTPTENPHSEYVEGMLTIQSLLNQMNSYIAVLQEFASFESLYALYRSPTLSTADIRTAAFDVPQSVSVETNPFIFYRYSGSQFNILYETSVQYRTEVQNKQEKDIANLTAYEFICTDFTAFLEKNISQYEQLILQSWLSFGMYAAQAAQRILAEDQKSYTDAHTFLKGVFNEQTQMIAYYPRESAALMQTTLDTAKKDIIFLNALYAKSAEIPSLIAQEQTYADAQAEITACIKKLESFAVSGGKLIADAKIQLQKATLTESEAELRYNQALSALASNNFTSARDSLQRASTKYTEALSLQESVSLRALNDQKLQKLGLDINRAENDIVIRDVRVLITQGKDLYSSMQFEKAENVFLQAKARWNLTNSEDNPEIKTWLSIVGTALSMKSGRTILPTAPLYAEMSQILSVANQFYAQGEALIKAGKFDEGAVLLRAAEAKLQDLQIVYPLNKDAGLLMLRISQVLDPHTFAASFSSKVNEARVNYKKAEEQQRAYSDLLDLYEINPSYPGLKALINEIEIYLGLKLPPPDQKKLAESSRLTSQAQVIFNTGNRDRYDEAIILLNNAITLNSDNNTALLLKDRILTNQGGSAVPVLSSADEAKYNKAVQDFQQGHITDAYAAVMQLLEKKENKNSAKILDLQKRVEGVLQ